MFWRFEKQFKNQQKRCPLPNLFFTKYDNGIFFNDSVIFYWFIVYEHSPLRKVPRGMSPHRLISLLCWIKIIPATLSSDGQVTTGISSSELCRWYFVRLLFFTNSPLKIKTKNKLSLQNFPKSIFALNFILKILLPIGEEQPPELVLPGVGHPLVPAPHPHRGGRLLPPLHGDRLQRGREREIASVPWFFSPTKASLSSDLIKMP